MQRLAVLGTGNAMVTKCYNTCFALCGEQETILVDAGGGNGILRTLAQCNINPCSIRHLIITHEHCDHLLGVVWVVRKLAMLMKRGEYEGNLYIHCHAALVQTVRTICGLTLQEKFTAMFDSRILFVVMTDGSRQSMLGCEVDFFDILSTKALQYGFHVQLPDGKHLTCLGDEPCNPLCEHHARGSDWLLSEAFCLYSEREKFQPYEKHHSTVKDACELAQRLDVKNLVLWHTEDKNYEKRHTLYTNEGKQYYTGNLFVPYDTEILTL